jgi:predicted site-specific integrase-resolvase
MRLIPVKMISKHVPVKPATLYRYAQHGIYPQLFKRFGGKLLVDLDEVERILNNSSGAGGREHPSSSTEGGKLIHG